MLLTMIVVVREQLYGKYHTKDTTMFFLAYGAYIFVPLLVMFRVASAPVFRKQPNGSTKQASKDKSD